MTKLQLLLLALLALLLVTAAVGDLRARIISNRLNVTVALLAIGWWVACGLTPAAIGWQIGVAILTFGLFVGVFMAGWMGGGDVKLIGALALWLPPLLLGRMLVWMVLAGGLLSLAVMLHHRWRRSEGTPEVPYGVAIASATLLVLTNHLLTISAA